MSRSFLQQPPSPGPGARSEDRSLNNKHAPLASLVKYHIPVVLLPPNKDKKTLNKADERESKDPAESPTQRPLYAAQTAPRKHNNNNKQRTEDILDDILPPREIVDGSRVWVQRVSSAPVEPYDATRVKERLELQMLQRDASSEGICPVRRELFDQCFDELVRQVALTCAERGLLLARVRDETRMTLAVYRALWERAAARVQRLEADNGELAARLSDQKIKYEAEMNRMKRRLSEEKARYEADLGKKREREKMRDNEEERRRVEELDFRKKCEEIITQLEMAPLSGSKTL